jgi:GntR family transcriptional regulator
MPERVVAHMFERYRGPEIASLPKYAWLREALREAIEDGAFPPGAQLPTEAELARVTPFSLGTVQKALRALVEEGVVVRRQGHGTFVAEKRRQMDVPWHCRFVGAGEGEFLPVYPKVVLRRAEAGMGPWSAILAPEGGRVLQIDRTIRIGEEFFVYSRYFAAARRFAGLLEKSDAELESTNFKILLRREYNQSVSALTQTLRMRPFPAAIAAAIGVPEGTVGMMLEIVASAGPTNPVYYQELFIPPNARKLYISDTGTLPEYWI